MENRLVSQTALWYDRLATMQEGYRYPWRSQLPPFHGEDVYFDLVRRHLRTDSDVLDAACGHGDVALAIAPSCRSVVGYDRTAPWIELAQRNARERDIRNARFICHDSSPDANGGVVPLPGATDAYDVLICSKGPFHWIEGVWGVARPGAVLLMLVPDATPLTAWHGMLPPSLRWQEAADPLWARPAIERRLAGVRLSLDAWWSFDVPERFPDPEQLYVWLSWGRSADEVEVYDAVRPTLEQIFDTHGDAGGLAVRYRRYLWKAVVPG